MPFSHEGLDRCSKMLENIGEAFEEHNRKGTPVYGGGAGTTITKGLQSAEEGDTFFDLENSVPQS